MPIYRVRPQPRVLSMCLTCRTTEKDPRQGSLLSAWTDRAMEKDWPKRPSDHQIQEAGKKDNDRAITPVVEAVRVLVHSTSPGSLQAKQLCHLHAQLSLEQSCNRRKRCCVYTHRVTSVVSYSLQPCRLWPARFLCQRGGFSRQEYWSILADSVCHTLLEHCISCCPSCQLPWQPSAARTPATQVAAPSPHLPSQGQTQAIQGSLRSKPQWTTHMQRWK